MTLRRAAACVTTVALAVLTACARSPVVGPPSTTPGAPPVEDVGDLAPALPDRLAALALALVGTPYRAGGASPSGFDCSGLVQYVFARHGLRLPRSVIEQSQIGTSVPRESIVAGDLLFFATSGRGPSHVGIATGPGAFVHAPNSKGAVRVEPLRAPYWEQRFVGARRVATPERQDSLVRCEAHCAGAAAVP